MDLAGHLKGFLLRHLNHRSKLVSTDSDSFHLRNLYPQMYPTLPSTSKSYLVETRSLLCGLVLWHIPLQTSCLLPTLVHEKIQYFNCLAWRIHAKKPPNSLVENCSLGLEGLLLCAAVLIMNMSWWPHSRFSLGFRIRIRRTWVVLRPVKIFWHHFYFNLLSSWFILVLPDFSFVKKFSDLEYSETIASTVKCELNYSNLHSHRIMIILIIHKTLPINSY